MNTSPLGYSNFLFMLFVRQLDSCSMLINLINVEVIMGPKHETRVLNLYIRLMRAANTVSEKMHKHLQGHKPTISQFGVLEALYYLGPLSQKDIGDKILKNLRRYL